MFDHDDERIRDWAVRKLRLCVEDVVSLDGSEVECVMNPLTKDEMVEAVKDGEGVSLEGVKARVMLMSDGSSEWGEHQEFVEGLRAGVMTDYGGTVLCNEIQPDPPTEAQIVRRSSH